MPCLILQHSFCQNLCHIWLYGIKFAQIHANFGFFSLSTLPLKIYFSRYSPRFMEDLVSNEFIKVTLDYAVLFMASQKCAFNPHLRKDIGPLLSACCPFDKRRAQDGGRGAAITTSGQVRHMALADYKNKKGLLASIIGVFCDCEYITDDDGFDSKLNFRLPFYTLLGTVFIQVKSKLDGSHV